VAGNIVSLVGIRTIVYRQRDSMNKLADDLLIRKVAKNEKGITIVLSLLVAIVFVILSGGYFNLLVVEGSNTARTYRSNLALHLAESGVEEAIWEINYNSGAFLSTDGWSGTGTNPRIKTTSLTTALGENLGSYTVTVTNPTSSTPLIKGVGQALYQAATLVDDRTVEVTLLVSNSPTFDMAIFADETLVIDSNACTDSFDSSLGPYDGPNTNPSPGREHTNYNFNGDIGTNSTSTGAVELDSNAHVYGDAFVGVDGDTDEVISVLSNSDISGTSSALSSVVYMPSIIGPTGLTDYGSITYNDDQNHTISSSGQYSNLMVDGNTTLTISGDVKIYVTGTFELNSNSDLNIETGSSVDIYVDGSIFFDSNATVNNNTQDPSKLRLYGTNSMVDNGDEAGIRLHSNTDIYAVVLAPNSTVDIDSNAELFGAVMADDIAINSNSCVHYDENLRKGGGPTITNASVVMWQEIFSL